MQDKIFSSALKSDFVHLSIVTPIDSSYYLGSSHGSEGRRVLQLQNDLVELGPESGLGSRVALRNGVSRLRIGKGLSFGPDDHPLTTLRCL